MRAGVSYLPSHNPKHLLSDLEAMKNLGCDDVLFALQENDLFYFTGKLDFSPNIAKHLGLNPIAIFWGALNLFGGGRSSQFLLENPDAHQVLKGGAYNSAGCFNNPKARAYVKQFIDRIAAAGFSGYFIDEPSVSECFCQSCRNAYEKMFDADLLKADDPRIAAFRKKAIVSYVAEIAGYMKNDHPKLQTLCCIMPSDKSSWQEIANIHTLDSLGTDIYLVNEDVDVEIMRPMVRELGGFCKERNKTHHQWLQAWGVKKGREDRIKQQGEILLQENPDALYVWAYLGQQGTSEACEDAAASWEVASQILRKAKNKL